MNIWKNSKLLDILSVFTRSEWRVFQYFVESGIGGPPGNAPLLLKVIGSHYPNFNTITTTRQALFKLIFPNEQYEDKKLRYAMTDLFRLASYFMVIRSLQNSDVAYDLMLQEEMAKRGADKAYISLYDKKADEVIHKSGHAADVFYRKFREKEIYLNHYFPRQQRKDYNPIGDATIMLDIFYIAKKLELLCEIINLRNVMSVHYDFFLQEEIVLKIKNGAFADVPVIGVYYRILMTLTEPENEIHFVELRKLLMENSAGFEKQELRDLYQYLMNYCIRQINIGNVSHVNILFEIYKFIIQAKIIYKDNYISQWDFKNIVTIGIRANENNWVYEFIESHKHELPKDERPNAYNYNLAYYYFGSGNYKGAISLLQKVAFTDLYYQLDTRAILLKCYYELNDEETLLYHISAFRIFLTRNKLISEYQRTTYRNLIKFTHRILHCNSSKVKLNQIKNQIEEVKQIADINWLRKKVQEQLNLRM